MSVSAGPARESREPTTWDEWVAANNRDAGNIQGSARQLRREASGGEYDQGHAVAVDYDALTDCLDALDFLLSSVSQDEMREVRRVVTDICTWQQRVIPEAPAIVGPMSLELLAMKLLKLRSLLGMNYGDEQ